MITPTAEKLMSEIVASKQFARLNNISFLGVIDKVIERNIKNHRFYSRAEHSKGVLGLILIANKVLKFDEEDLLLMISAALTHDLAHTPLSHSLEYAFSPDTRVGDHHEKLKEILCNPSKKYSEVNKILIKYNVSPEKVFAVVNNDVDLGFFFSSPFNADTLDGITRVFWTMGSFAPYNPKLLMEVTAKIYLGDKIFRRDIISEMDMFWASKDKFYNGLLTSDKYGLFEYEFQNKARDQIGYLDDSFFFMDDRQLSLFYPELLEESDLPSDGEHLNSKQEFIIDQDISYIDRDTVSKRYARRRLV